MTDSKDSASSFGVGLCLGRHRQWTKTMVNTGLPDLLDVEYHVSTLVHIPILQNMQYSSYTRSAHHPPGQPILTENKTKKWWNLFIISCISVRMMQNIRILDKEMGFHVVMSKYCARLTSQESKFSRCLGANIDGVWW